MRVSRTPLSEVMRTFLLDHYEGIAAKNGRFSMRAYATRLGLDSSTLSKILRGKRTITQEMFEHLSARLALGGEQKNRLLQSAYQQHGASQARTFQPIAQDVFKVIGDWYHFAILELMQTRNFRPDARWVARRLGLSTSVVHAALQRLVRAGYLKMQGRTWTDQVGNTSTGDPGEDKAAFRKLQAQLLEKATEALEAVPFEKRDQSSLTFAVHPSRLPELKQRLDEFRRSIAHLAESDDDREAVYCLLLSLFPVTKENVDVTH